MTAIVRLNPNGTFDNTFNGTGKSIIPTNLYFTDAESQGNNIIISSYSSVTSPYSVSLTRVFNSSTLNVLPLGLTSFTANKINNKKKT